MRDLRINERFKDACPSLSEDEFERLESLIVKDGVIFNPILIWNDVIIDGHNRYNVAKKHKIEFTTNEISFESDEEAICWIKEKNNPFPSKVIQTYFFDFVINEGIFVKVGSRMIYFEHVT